MHEAKGLPTSYSRVQPHPVPSSQRQRRSCLPRRQQGTCSDWCLLCQNLVQWLHLPPQESSPCLESASTLPQRGGSGGEGYCAVLVQLAWLLIQLKAAVWVSVLQAMLAYIGNRLARQRHFQFSPNRFLWFPQHRLSLLKVIHIQYWLNCRGNTFAFNVRIPNQKPSLNVKKWGRFVFVVTWWFFNRIKQKTHKW